MKSWLNKTDSDKHVFFLFVCQVLSFIWFILNNRQLECLPQLFNVSQPVPFDIEYVFSGLVFWSELLYATFCSRTYSKLITLFIHSEHLNKSVSPDTLTVAEKKKKSMPLYSFIHSVLSFSIDYMLLKYGQTAHIFEVCLLSLLYSVP